MKSETIQCLIICITLSFMCVSITRGEPFRTLEKHDIDWETLVGVIGASIAAWATIFHTKKSVDKQLKLAKLQAEYNKSSLIHDKITSAYLHVSGIKSTWVEYSKLAKTADGRRELDFYRDLMKNEIINAKDFDKSIFLDIGLATAHQALMNRIRNVERVLQENTSFQNMKHYQLRSLRDNFLNLALWARRIESLLQEEKKEHFSIILNFKYKGI